MIHSRQISRADALESLKVPPLDSENENQIINYVCKKLEISRHDFEAFMNVENKSYKDYRNWDQKRKLLSLVHRIFKKITGKSIINSN